MCSDGRVAAGKAGPVRRIVRCAESVLLAPRTREGDVSPMSDEELHRVAEIFRPAVERLAPVLAEYQRRQAASLAPALAQIAEHQRSQAALIASSVAPALIAFGERHAELMARLTGPLTAYQEQLAQALEPLAEQLRSVDWDAVRRPLEEEGLVESEPTTPEEVRELEKRLHKLTDIEALLLLVNILNVVGVALRRSGQLEAAVAVDDALLVFSAMLSVFLLRDRLR